MAVQDRAGVSAPVSEPDVSVIIPVYNAMPYLWQCVDSVLEQTIGLGRLEIIAVDDGSTDGGGAVLDGYAARHPGVVTVIHQPNSGGPALPCNRGLDLARGRYVFFLGADDYLGHEALERLVAKADTWGSDVIFGVMKGVGGRYVDQRIFARSVRDLDFTSSPLPYALSNTKLFRRSLLEQHRIRYALDLRVGSDQPFVIEALTYASRISVLDDYVYYYAVRRAESTNITYSTSWRSRLTDITAVIRHIADVVAPGPIRDAILARHFGSELDKLLRRQLPGLAPAEQAEIMAGIGALADDLWTERLGDRLEPEVRVRLRLAWAGDRLLLLDVLAYQNETKRAPVVLRSQKAYVWSPALDSTEAALPWHRITDDQDVLDRLARSLELERLRIDGDTLRLRGRIGLTADNAALVRLVLSPVDGPSPAKQLLGVRPGGADLDVDLRPLGPVAGAEFTTAVPLASLAEGTGRVRFAVRIGVGLAQSWCDLPLRWSGDARQLVIRRGLRIWVAQIKPTKGRRLVVTLTRRPLAVVAATSLRRRAGALVRRAAGEQAEHPQGQSPDRRDREVR